MLPFLLFVAGVLVCVGMYIADHRRAVAREEERSKASTENPARSAIVRRIVVLICFSAFVLLSGCAMESTAPSTPTAGPQITGRAMGAQQAITGSRIYLMKADTTGYGNAATDILTAGDGSDSIGYYVLTGTGGAFTLTSYTCTQNDQIYILSLQGNPGLTPSNTNNAHLAIMAMLGSCPAAGNFITATPFVTINEITTIAAAYAMGGFMSSPTQMSSSSANASVGLANAALVAGSLASIATGATYTSGTTPNGNGTYSVNKVNTLADIIASCVNTDGSTTTGAACATLFTNAVNGSTQPTDTITAALNMVHFPSQNVSTLLGLAPGTAPFQPTLSPAPSDLSLSIAYASVDSNSASTYATHIDNLGNIYKSDGASKPSGTTRAVNPLGAVVATYNTTVEDQPTGAYTDPNNQNLWVVSGNVNKLTVYNTTSHSAVTGSGFIDGTYSDGLAFDNSNNVYSVTNGCALVKGLNASPFTATSYTLTGACSSNNGFGYLAITSGGTIWVAQGNASWTVSTTTTAAPGTSTNITSNSVGATGYKESGVVIDSSQNAWVMAYNSSTKANQLAAWDSTQTPLTNSPWATSVPGPYAIGALSIDGANLLWGSTTYGPVSILTSSPGSPLTKIANTSYVQGQCIPDQSGNVWCGILHGLIMYPGIATPTANPVSPSNHGTKP